MSRLYFSTSAKKNEKEQDDMASKGFTAAKTDDIENIAATRYMIPGQSFEAAFSFFASRAVMAKALMDGGLTPETEQQVREMIDYSNDQIRKHLIL